MRYREFGNTGRMISALGFGAMRLPKDEELAEQVISRALDLGVNYVDSALGYCGTRSEVIVGRAVKGRRDRVYLSTKNPLGGDPTREGWRARLELQLKKLDTDHIDFYHAVHDLKWQTYLDNYSKAGIYEARRAKQEGLIHHLCFSCHDSPENLIRLIDTGEFEGMTVQYNLLDRANERTIGHAHERGMGVMVMGPVAGGRLAFPSQEAANPQAAGPVEIALRFVLAHPGVTAALSGMNTFQMVEENAATASRPDPMSPAEWEQAAAAMQRLEKLADLYCTGCRYCLPCPHGVEIPENFTALNYLRVYGLAEPSRRLYLELAGHQQSADFCRQCGECEPKCPQQIPIVSRLEEAAGALGE